MDIKQFTQNMTSVLHSNTLLYLLKCYKSQHDEKVISNCLNNLLIILSFISEESYHHVLYERNEND